MAQDPRPIDPKPITREFKEVYDDLLRVFEKLAQHNLHWGPAEKQLADELAMAMGEFEQYYWPLGRPKEP